LLAPPLASGDDVGDWGLKHSSAGRLLFQLFLFSKLSVADSRCKIRSCKWHFPPAFWAGGQEGRWSSCTMTDYADPHGASNQSQQWERNAAHL